MNELLGKRIKKLYINDDKTILVFETATRELIGFQTEGECCNSVWFDKVSGVSALRRYDEEVFDVIAGGATVNRIEEKSWTEIPTDDEEGYHDVLENCIITIATDHGYLDIEVRNSHNGYYGGHVNRFEVSDVSKYSLLKHDVE